MCAFVFVAHTAGRYAKKQFAKGRMPIVERLVNRLVLASALALAFCWDVWGMCGLGRMRKGGRRGDGRGVGIAEWEMRVEGDEKG